MTSQEKWLRRFRIGAFAVIIVLTTLAIVGVSAAGINAPLLTIMGSATIIIALFSIDRGTFTIQNIGTVLGTAIVMGGGGFWLFDAIQKNPIVDVRLYWTQTILTALILLLLSFLILLATIYLTGQKSERDEK